ncbi:MAG: RNA polymerase sigma factor [Rubripirellula sp.]
MNLISNPADPVQQSPVAGSLALQSDADLLDAWTGDQHADSLATLVNRYSVMVLSVCRRRARTEADAEDAFQTTFLYLARNGGKIRHPERLAGWLHRVAQRAAVATLQTAQREFEPMVDPPADPDDPLDRLAQRHEAIVLDEELADLPEHYRSAIVLHLYEGLPILKLAEHFGTSAGSIRGRLQRGKHLLSQRLRRRGVVPVLAFSAANVWTVSNAQASTANAYFCSGIQDAQLPNPPVNTPLLESLLSQGVRLMPSLYTAAGVLGSSALIALAMISGDSQGQSPANQLSFSTQRVEQVAPSGSLVIAQAIASPQQQKKNGANGTDASKKPQPGSLVWTQESVVPEPTSATAAEISNAMDSEIEMMFETTLFELPDALRQALEQPVLWDGRAIELSKQKLDQPIKIHEENIPMRTGLHQLLNPLGLKAVVQDEGLMITADMSVLVHKGIGATRWTNIDEEAEKKIAAALASETRVQFADTPLNDAVNTLSALHQVPIMINRRALEEIGLSSDIPVRLEMAGVKLKSVLSLVLSELDLTYTVQGESLTITSVEDAEQNLINRVYWLEGTGLPSGDFQSILESIQTSITPETWEALGGPSTMAPLISARPAIVISTTYHVHENIDQFFNVLRETHFGQDPIMKPVQVPLTPQMTPMTGGGPGGGGGGGGGFF